MNICTQYTHVSELKQRDFKLLNEEQGLQNLKLEAR
jgi:hypothetical protein